MLLKDMFDIAYGQKEYHSKTHLKGNIGKTPLISSKGTNNGVYGLYNIIPKYKNIITVPSAGTVCYASYQGINCCVDDNCLVLTPKIDLSEREMMYYTLIVRMEKYKYLYGRQVTPKRLGEIKVPSKEEIPNWVYEMELPKYEVINGRHTEEPTPSLDVEKWGSFKYSDLFDISIGKSTDLNKLEQVEDGVNYVGRTDVNNGVTAKVKVDNSIEVYKGSCLTVPMVGNVMKSTYQNSEFTTSQNILILRLKEDKSAFVYLFISTLIHREQYRFNYGRSLSFDRLDGLKLKLPITKEGTPDWEFMEKYIKTLKYSKEL